MTHSDENLETSRTLLMRLRQPDDAAAWSEFVERYGPRILAWCRRFHLQESDVSDATQEVLVKLVRALRTFDYDRSRGSFRGWLKTVTENTVRDLVGQWRRAILARGDTATRSQLAEVEDAAAVRELTESLDREYQLELLAEAERRVRARVKPNTWQAYWLTSIDGRSPADAAAELSMPVSEIYVAKSRVLKMLRECVESLEGAGQGKVV